MAGAVHLFTKESFETKISTTSGNYGLVQTSASVGINEEKINVNLSMDSLKHCGYHVSGTDGNKDRGKQTKSSMGAAYTTDNGTIITLDISRDTSDTRYPSYLTDAQFAADPSQNGTGNNYTFREADSSTTNLNIKRKWGDNLEFTTNRSAIDRESQNTYWYSTGTVDKYKYDYNSNDYLLTYTNGNIKIDSGVNIFDGKRTVTSTNASSRNTTSKENLGIFSQLQYSRENSVFTIGARNEKVDYEYNPESGSKLTGEYDLNAFEIGVNTSLSPNTSVFTNYNHAFQAPLIDRFFISASLPATGQVFNGFVKPSKSKNINVGLNHLTNSSKTKLTLYRSNVTD